MHTNTKSANSINTVNIPAAIAMITPVDKLLAELLVEGVGDDSSGGDDGERKNLEHGGRGVPHSNEFPANDVLGNFCREFGMDPLRLLLLILNRFNFGRFRSGI